MFIAPRVDPMQSRKVTALLQAANAGSRLILLRTSSSSGHGIGTTYTETINQEADVFAFLFERLGMTYTPPSAARGQ